MAIINVPAPAGSHLAGQIQMQQLAGLGQALGLYFGREQQEKLWGQDIQNLQQTQGIFDTMYGARGLESPQAPFLPQSRLGKQLGLQGLIGNIFADPLEREYLRARIGATRALEEDRRKPEKTKIQKLIEEGYNPSEAKHVLDIFHGLKPRASAAKSLEQKSLPEQLSFWQTVYNKTLDPEWGGTRPTEDMDAARELAKQNIDRITAGMRQSTQTNIGFGADLKNALSAIRSGAPRDQVYRRLVKAYPSRAAEIKRLLSTQR